MSDMSVLGSVLVESHSNEDLDNTRRQELRCARRRYVVNGNRGSLIETHFVFRPVSTKRFSIIS